MKRGKGSVDSKSSWRTAIVCGVLGFLALPLFLAAVHTVTSNEIESQPEMDKSKKIAFSGDGKMIAVRGSFNLCIWEVSSGKVLQDLPVSGDDKGPLGFLGDVSSAKMKIASLS
jgi:hypothetical protein